MIHLVSGLLLWSLLAAPQSRPAHDPPEPRERLLGQTLDRDGKAWPGTTVRLISWPIPDCPAFGAPDVVEVRSDTAGEFQAELLPCRAYSAFARADAGDGGVWFSKVTWDVLAATRLVLRQEAAPRGARAVQVAGLQAWQGAAKLRLRVVWGAVHHETTELQLDAAGHAMLPPIPGGVCWLVLVDEADRAVLVAAENPGAPPRPIELRLGPPVRVRVIVNADDAAKTKVAGASLWISSALGKNRAGTTDAGGRCELWRPASTAAAVPGLLTVGLLVQVDAPGWRPAAARVDEDGKWNDQDQAREVRIAMRRGATAHGRLVGPAGEPLAGVGLLLSTKGSTLQEGRGPVSFDAWPRPVTTAADGSFALASLDPEFEFQLLADPRTLRPLCNRAAPEATAFPFGPIAVLARGRAADGQDLDLGSLRVDAASSVRLEVHAADGAPVPNARLDFHTQWLPVAAEPPSLPPFHADTRGRLRLLLPSREYALTAAGAGGQVSLSHVNIPSAAPRTAVLRIDCEQALSLSGTVVDPDGVPVAGARVSTNPLAQFGGSDAAIARHVFNLRALQGTTDANGRFQLWFLPCASAVVQAGDPGGRRSSATLQLGDAPVAGVELRLRPALHER